jgi:hydroxymethylbilane synthase
MSETRPILRLGSRGSPLALAQAEAAKARLGETHPELAAEGAVEIVVVRTTGDKEQKRRLAEIGGKGLFTKELEDALFDGRIDVAVHSMKDVPTWLPEGLSIPAMLEREDPRDAWFSSKGDSIAALPEGAVVGTASMRRQAQVLAWRPDLKVVNFRGNLQTRLRKLADGEVDATMLALAGLRRMGMADKATAVLSTDELLPAVGQGAIGLEVRADDARAHDLVAAVNHAPSALRVNAERACLDVLDGSCRTPIGVLAEFGEDGRDAAPVRLRALVAAPDGSRIWRAERSGPPEQAESLARDAGAELRKAAGESFFEALADIF